MTNTPRRSLRTVLAVACTLLLAGIAAVVLSTRDAADPDRPADGTPATDPTTPVSTVSPATAPTPTASTTTEPTTTAPTTSISAADDAALARAILLPADEYGSGWIRGGGTIVDRYLSVDVAAGLPECAEAIDPVFRFPHDHAVVAEASYRLEEPVGALFSMRVFVFDSEDAASTWFTAVNDTSAGGVLDCLRAYELAIQGSNCCNGGPPAPIPAVAAGTSPFDPPVDPFVFRRWDASWVEPGPGTVHGPEECVSAAMRLGRVVAFIDTLHLGDADQPQLIEVVSDAAFGDAVDHVVTRARAALAVAPEP